MSAPLTPSFVPERQHAIVMGGSVAGLLAARVLALAAPPKILLRPRIVARVLGLQVAV